MRTLSPAPAEVAFGSFRGALPRIDWSSAAGPIDRRLRSKKWLYVGLASDDAWLSLAILRTGYAANILAYVYDRRRREMIFDKTVVAPRCQVTDDVHASGMIARYGDLSVDRSGPDLTLRGKYGGLELDLVLDESQAPAGIVAIAELGIGLRNATEKRALTSCRGTFKVDGRILDADGATGGWDYTNGLMPRHTKWRWAYGLGKDIAFNLVEGFVGEAECAAFTRSSDRDEDRDSGGVHPLGEPRFTFNPKRPKEPWRIEGEGVDLRFEVGAVHQQHTNLLVVRSRFVQPVGTFFGKVRGISVDGIPGVVEDQDVVW